MGGTTRWRRYLDHLILSLCHDDKTYSSMEPLLLQVDRNLLVYFGCNTIIHLDKECYRFSLCFTLTYIVFRFFELVFMKSSSLKCLHMPLLMRSVNAYKLLH